MHDDHDPRSSALLRDLVTLAHRTTTGRRRVLGWLAAASALPAVGCGDDASEATSGAGGAGATSATGATGDTSTTADASTTAGTTSTTSTTGAGGGTCEVIPTETAGPFPGNGTNGPNALTLSGIVRSDITPSLGEGGAIAAGVPLSIELTLVDASGCAPLVGYAIYAWHCDIHTDYSMYTGAAVTLSYLRGVQETDANGVVTFLSIFPGCYSGRWPHVHFEVYPSLASATNGQSKVATSQLAFPEDACAAAYATAGYEASVTNLAGVSLETDGVFSDGATLQLATMTGDATDGFVAKLVVAIEA
jgi:protocatechuate 3,4-dioxygenase beta subunit